jgi:2-polyprenyl-3-methyl-5-hydroxy-6-metoxy-1,4-benzoquinol methylase
MDCTHVLIYERAMQGLHRASLNASNGPLRILDVGCGSCIWLVDMSSAYPQAEICGIDIDPRIPGDDLGPSSFGSTIGWRCPLNFESAEWGFPPGCFDFIHMGQLCGSVSDWERLCSTALR